MKWKAAINKSIEAKIRVCETKWDEQVSGNHCRVWRPLLLTQRNDCRYQDVCSESMINEHYNGADSGCWPIRPPGMGFPTHIRRCGPVCQFSGLADLQLETESSQYYLFVSDFSIDILMGNKSSTHLMPLNLEGILNFGNQDNPEPNLKDSI